MLLYKNMLVYIPLIIRSIKKLCIKVLKKLIIKLLE